MNNNRITVTGLLGSDGEFVRTKNGMEMYENSLAVGYKQNANEWGTCWFSVKTMNETACDILENLEKGDKVEITGGFTIDGYVRKGDTKEYHKITVWADEVKKLEKGKNTEEEKPKRRRK